MIALLRRKYFYVFLITLLLSIDISKCKHSSRSRGSSSSRLSKIGHKIGDMLTGNRHRHSPSGIFAGGGHGNRMGHSFGGDKGIGTRPKFSTGSGIGSMLRSNQFKTAIAGAAAGYITYRLGKAVIRSAGNAMMWNNRPYYWSSNYYRPVDNMFMCSMPLMENDGMLGNVYFDDGSRPKQIVWACRNYVETCCGYECCNNY